MSKKVRTDHVGKECPLSQDRWDTPIGKRPDVCVRKRRKDTRDKCVLIN